MDLDNSYGWEKLYSATRILIGSDPIQKRLTDAIMLQLSHITPENDLPDEYHQEFNDIVASLEKVTTLTDEQAVTVARKVVDLHDSVAKWLTERRGERLA